MAQTAERIEVPGLARKLAPPPLAFGNDDVQRAVDEWNCSCGPAALAAALGITLNMVRPYVGEDFVAKGYMSPTMMKAAIERVGRRIVTDDRTRYREAEKLPADALVRIQWEGPWTAPGMNARWAYGATHWVWAQYWVPDLRQHGRLWIFDINQGWAPAEYWERETVPLIVANVKRATRGWYATHSWTIARGAQ